ncbi:hypothetical protein [Sphingomonas xanthus]|uniref:Uncharacterized protein n=1 Tax=Sphingomonas xanthus TaxID=2594473 RepID=A0A516IQN9_9SPHN|nr:hypothetical protein [Sphingomonas xanthus]QDP19228.1 hypothetical protein FMM02_04175 [Sphingomonas xanthus]
MTASRRMKCKSLLAIVALVLAVPAGAQNSDAPVDVTAAPTTAADTVGPSQLRNFSLEGSVTRPAERPAQQQPAQQATPQPSAEPPARPASAATSDRSAAPVAAPSTRADAQPTDARPSIEPSQTEGLTAALDPGAAGLVPAPAITESVPLDVTVGNSADNKGLGWAWILALMAATAGIAYLGWNRFGRREQPDPGRMAFAGLAPDDVSEAPSFPPARTRPDPAPPRSQPAPAPRPAAPAAPPAVPEPKAPDDGLIVSTAFKPDLRFDFRPDRAVVTEHEVMLQFELVIVNAGTAPARDVLVEGALFGAHARQDQEIAEFFGKPNGQGDRMPAIAARGRVGLRSAVKLPIDALHSFELEGRKLFVPIVAFNILFRTGSGESQASASFLVGRGNESDAKLAPFRLDLGPRIFRGLSARPHSAGLQRQGAAA